MYAAVMCSCAIAVPLWFCSALACCFGFWFAKVTPVFCRFIRLLLVQKCSGVIAPCFIHRFAVSSAVMPPRRTQNSLKGTVLPVSLAPASTTSIAVPTSVQASGTPPSTFILPEFLASVIQAIQSPISAIRRQSLSAVVSAHSVSQGLPTIAAQGSSLATHAAHLDACGFYQPWFPSGPTGVLPSTSSSSTPPIPVAMPTNMLTGMSSSLHAVFHSCFFLGFLVFYSTLFFGSLQPSDYN